VSTKQDSGFALTGRKSEHFRNSFVGGLQRSTYVRVTDTCMVVYMLPKTSRIDKDIFPNVKLGCSRDMVMKQAQQRCYDVSPLEK